MERNGPHGTLHAPPIFYNCSIFNFLSNNQNNYEMNIEKAYLFGLIMMLWGGVYMYINTPTAPAERLMDDQQAPPENFIINFYDKNQIPGTSQKQDKEIGENITFNKFNNQTAIDYIERYKQLAKDEEKRYGIPASITIAQGLLESNAGNSRLATQLNNHFGMKCFSKNCKKGHCKNFTDDSHKDFFLTFESIWFSYREHSKFLHGKRYRHLLNLKKNDYKGWAYGLKKAGYATDPNYHKNLIKIIEKYKLHEL